MKYIFNIIFLTSSLVGSAQNFEFTFPEFDSKLIAIWQGENDSSVSHNEIAALHGEWEKAKRAIKTRKISHVDLDEFIYTIDREVKLLGIFKDAYMHDFAAMLAYKILLDFKLMRERVDPNLYPLDRLLDVHVIFNEIEGTVYDQMFGLLEWFEFEDLMCELTQDIQEYSKVSINEVQKYFPEIKNAEHFLAKQKMKECYSSLVQSLETGFIPDFRLPCDELKYAIKDLINLYQNQNELHLSDL